MSITTYPLDGKYYNAQDAETYLCTRTSGVFSEDISFTPNGMNITVSPFLAWIKNDDFSGKSVAVTTDTTLTISPSEPILSRIDRIVLRFDARKNGSELMVLKGTPSSSPAVPSISRTPVIYDLCLCQISVKPSATSISAGDITSTLLDESLCGIMRDGVTGIPTNQLVAQCQDLIKELNTAISMAEKGSPVLQSLGIKRGTITMVLGEQGEKIYKSGDISFDVPFLSTPTVVVTRCVGTTQDDTVAKYVKPQVSVYANESSFNLNVFREVTGITAELKYNWIATGKVSWDDEGGGGGDGGDEEDDTEYFTISTSIDPLDSGITEGAGNFAKGSTTKLVARAFSGYMFEGWYSGNSKITSNSEYTVTVNSNATYTAKFVEAVPDIVVQINVDPVGTGTVSGAGTYPKGSTINLGATPKDGYKFVGWYVGNTKYASTPDYSVTLNASTTFTARFEEEVVTPDYYTVIAKVTPTGSGTVTGGGQYVPGATAKLKATANEGYVFSYWSSGTETITSAEFTFVVSSNRTWTAHFIEGEEETGKVTITTRVEPANSGTVTGGGEVTSGSMSAVQANANSGYKFKHWRFENGTTNTENPYLFRASADRTFVAVFEEKATTETTDFQYSVSNNQATITGYTGTGGNVAIPSTLEGYSVTSIGEAAFAGNNNITSVTIPNSVTRIDMSAFYNCRNLASIEIPDSVTYIDKGAFYLCTSLEGITIPNSITYISENTFDNCTSLKNITIPNSVTYIDYEAFVNCKNLKDIYYNGTKAEWNNVSMNNAFEDLTILTVHCTDGDVNYVWVDFEVSPANSGTITTSPVAVKNVYNADHYIKGTNVNLTAAASGDYKFKEWTVDDESLGATNPVTVAFNGDSFVKAVFEEEVTTTETAKLYIYSSNAGTGDVVKLTKDEAGTQSWNKNEFSEGETAYFFAQAGTGRIIERLVFKIDNSTVADMTADEMVEEGILNSDKNKLSQQHYVSEGQTSEFVATVYFGEAAEKKTITFFGSYGTTKVVCNGVELSNSKYNFTHEFDIGDEVTLTFTPDSGYQFSSWINDDTIATLSYDNPWTFTVDSSTAIGIGIIYNET